MNDDLYFDEFISLATNVTGELFYCIYDCFYQYIPIAITFLKLRQQYK